MIAQNNTGLPITLTTQITTQANPTQATQVQQNPPSLLPLRPTPRASTISPNLPATTNLPVSDALAPIPLTRPQVPTSETPSAISNGARAGTLQVVTSTETSVLTTELIVPRNELTTEKRTTEPVTTQVRTSTNSPISPQAPTSNALLFNSKLESLKLASLFLIVYTLICFILV